MKAIERMVMFYLPRICNHCLNPSCVASCPSGAMYKRGEDGIVLINQDRCRAWRSCISACPYKKTYYNWSTGKSEKCILCFPRLEAGEAPACFHSCVGRIRYLGNVLYDADLIKQAALKTRRGAGRGPARHDPRPARSGRHRGGPRLRRSRRRDRVGPALAGLPLREGVEARLPLHVEYRTFPMLFYVPPLLPVMSVSDGDLVRSDVDELFADIEKARAPIEYLGQLFSAGNVGKVRYALRKQLAVRIWRRHVTVGDMTEEAAKQALSEADCTPEQADEIYRPVRARHLGRPLRHPPVPARDGHGG